MVAPLNRLLNLMLNSISICYKNIFDIKLTVEKRVDTILILCNLDTIANGNAILYPRVR